MFVPSLWESAFWIALTAILDKVNENIYKKITEYAKDLVETGDKIATEYGIPIVNKRISVTPIALVGGAACHTSRGLCDHCKNTGQSCQDCRR